MRLHLLQGSMVLAISLLSSVSAHAQEMALDFPAGLFSDGKSYRMSDFEGKVVVLFFYESTCPKCRGLIPERNKVVKALQDQPVKFIAIGASDTMQDVQAYARDTKLAMPIFVDSLGLMEKRYGMKISLQNIYQFRVYGPDGKLVATDMSEETLKPIVAKASWKYNHEDYEKKLYPALDSFEWGQFADGTKLLKPLRKSTNKTVAESANKLYELIKEEGKKWQEAAEAAVEERPLEAYDLYAKLAIVFAGDELAKTAAAPLKKLAGTKAVKDELAARKAYGLLLLGMARSTPAQRKAASLGCQGFLKKYASTPTGERVAELVKELSE